MVCTHKHSCSPFKSQLELTEVLEHADCIFMDLNMTQIELDDLPPVVSVSRDSGSQLIEASQQNATIALWLPHYSSFDFNVVLLWIMAVGTFVAAGLWAGHDSTGNEDAYLKAEGNQEVGRLQAIECTVMLLRAALNGWTEGAGVASRILGRSARAASV